MFRSNSISILLSRGMKNSIKINIVAVFIKIAIILIFIFAGLHFIKPANYHPFLPYHFSGVIKGATTVFFAFLGSSGFFAFFGMIQRLPISCTPSIRPSLQSIATRRCEIPHSFALSIYVTKFI